MFIGKDAPVFFFLSLVAVLAQTEFSETNIPQLKVLAWFNTRLYPFILDEETKNIQSEWKGIQHLPYNRHSQPIRKPHELGFYSLRDKEIRQKQVDLAQIYGVDGFIYYQYWLENKPVMHDILQKRLSEDRFSFPFTLCLMNEPFEYKRLDGTNATLHMKYDKLEALVKYLVPFFRHKDYIRIDSKPVYVVLNYDNSVGFKNMIKTLRQRVLEHGLAGLHIMQALHNKGANSFLHPFADSGIEYAPDLFVADKPCGNTPGSEERVCNWMKDYAIDGHTYNGVPVSKAWSNKTRQNIEEFRLLRHHAVQFHHTTHQVVHPRCVYLPSTSSSTSSTQLVHRGGMVRWDATPLQGQKTIDKRILPYDIMSSPHIFGNATISRICKVLCDPNPNREPNFYALFAWNEWMQGSILEPTNMEGRAFLAALMSARQFVKKNWPVGCQEECDEMKQLRELRNCSAPPEGCYGVYGCEKGDKELMKEENEKERRKEKPSLKVLAWYSPWFHNDGRQKRTDKHRRQGFKLHSQMTEQEWGHLHTSPMLKKLSEKAFEGGPSGNEYVYDLTRLDVRKEQGLLAKEFGVDGFIFPHFYTDNKMFLMDVVAQRVLDGEPNLPFMLSLLNQPLFAHRRHHSINNNYIDNINNNGTGEGVFEGVNLHTVRPRDNKQMMFYNHPDWLLDELMPFFQHEDYIRVDGRPAYIIYHPLNTTMFLSFIDGLQFLARQKGLPGLYLIQAIQNKGLGNYVHEWADAAMVITPHTFLVDKKCVGGNSRESDYFCQDSTDVHTFNGVPVSKGWSAKTQQNLAETHALDQHPHYVSSHHVIHPQCAYNLPNQERIKPVFRGGIVKGGFPGHRFHNENAQNIKNLTASTPELFEKATKIRMCKSLCDFNIENTSFYSIHSWNDWSAGTGLEPNNVDGKSYLKALNTAKTYVLDNWPQGCREECDEMRVLRNIKDCHAVEGCHEAFGCQEKKVNAMEVTTPLINRRTPLHVLYGRPEVTVFAWYFPQFYPFPENDLHWGEGYTDWTVLKVAPEFNARGGQIRRPGELGYYDLRDRNVLAKQAKLAREYGVDGFIFYHYWLDNKPVMTEVLAERLKSGEPNVRFMLCLVNEPWQKRTFDVKNNRMGDGQITLKMLYDDPKGLFKYLLPFFRHKDYVRIDTKPVYIIYHPLITKHFLMMVEKLRRLAVEHGLPGLHIMQVIQNRGMANYVHDFADAGIEFAPNLAVSDFADITRPFTPDGMKTHFACGTAPPNGSYSCFYDFKINYNGVPVHEGWSERTALNVKNTESQGFLHTTHEVVHPRCVYNVDRHLKNIHRGGTVRWDSTPRYPSKTDRKMINHAVPPVPSSPEKFKKTTISRLCKVMCDPNPKGTHFSNIYALFAWNEWGEGAVLEPSDLDGRAYLIALKEARQYVRENWPYGCEEECREMKRLRELRNCSAVEGCFEVFGCFDAVHKLVNNEEGGF